MPRGKLYAGIAALLVLAAAWAYLRRTAAAPSNGYVDPATCANCHRAMAEGFRKTGMGRSFSKLRPETAPEDFTHAKTFYHQASDTYFATVQRGGEFLQRRWQTGFDGRETNLDEKRIDYVMGSGNHSRTYFHLTSRNTLQQLPLHWYAEKGGSWAMSPGYDRPDHPGSTRLAGYECMFCHNAYPKIPPGHQETGAEWVYLQPLPEGIDCQRCHGPGKRHVDLAGTAGAKAEKIRAAIVNPKRLPPERAMEVCMQCHLHTTAGKLPASIQRAGRGPFSYAPGQPLGDFRLAFERSQGQLERFENLSSAYRLRKSQCFIRSEGKLQCITCHNPHRIPRGKEAADYYNAKCLECHATAEKPEGADCVTCHMPKRRTDDEVHVVMTDHYIQRVKPPGDLLAEKLETHETPATQYRGEVVLYYPPRLAETVENALELAAAQIRDGSNLQNGLPRLAGLLEKHRPSTARYYADLAEGYLMAGDTAKAIPYFEEAVRRSPAPAFLLTKLGNALSEARQWAKAEAALRRATALTPDDAGAWGMLGWALWQQDKAAEARAALEKSIALDPEAPEMHNNLASLLGGAGDLAAAEKELRAALRILPGIAEWQLNLGRLLASRGELVQARYLFEQSVRLKPDDAVARLDYARLLAAMDRTNEAEKQAKAAVEAGAGMAPAHQVWGSLLAAKGDLNGAAREFQAAVRLQPDLWGAHLELGMALGRKGDTAGAVEHLKIAAGGTDAQAKAAAQQLLQRLGR